MARPETYTEETGDLICEKLAEGISLKRICEDNDMPDKSTFFRWLRKHPELRDNYARAKEESADALFEELANIGDEAITAAGESDPKASNAVVQAHKLKADNIKWQSSKMKPKKYGNTLDLTTQGDKLPTPIYGGLSRHNSDKEDISTEEKD